MKKPLVIVLIVLGVLSVVCVCGGAIALILSTNPSKVIEKASVTSTNPVVSSSVTVPLNTCDSTATKYSSGKELVLDNTFSGSENWEMQVWFRPNATTTDTNLFIPDGGYRVNAVGPTATSTRSGILQDINSDVHGAGSIVLKARVKVDNVRQSGSGSQGREAPLAIGIIYYDSNCVLHNTLGETPNDTNRMYWHGFNYLAGTNGYETGGYSIVDKGVYYDYEANLANLDISVIKSIGVEGSGWFQRDGSISSISLIAN